MLGKNNKYLKNTKEGTKVESYSIKKFKVGAASVVVGASIFFGAGVAAAADTQENTADKNTTTEKSDATATSDEAPKAVAQPKTETTAKEATTSEVAKAVENKTTKEEVKVDATALNTLISDIKANKEAGDYDKYTEESVKALEEAVKNAEVTEKTATTQEAIDKAIATLTEKAAGLKEKEAKTEEKATEAKAETIEANKKEEATTKTEVAEAKKELDHLVAEGQVLAPAVAKEATKVEDKEAKSNLEAAVETVNTKVAEAINVLKNDEATKDDVTKKSGELRSAMEGVVAARTRAGINTPVSVQLDDTETGNTLDTDVASSDGLTKILDENGVLVDKSQAVDPSMNDAHGAKVEDKTPPTFNGTQLQPTSVEGRYTFQYMGLYWLDFALKDKTDPNEYYIRASRSTEESDTTVLLEMVKIADNTVLESHTLTSGQTGVAFTSLKSVSSDARVKAYEIYTGYDKTTAKDNSLGQILIYFAQYGGPYMMGSYDIPILANYVTRYITEDGTPLADYTVKASADQIVTPSDVRDFTDYIIKETKYQGTPEINVDKLDVTALDAENYGYKRLVRIINPEGTAIKTVWIKDPTYTGDIKWDDASTTGFIKVLETTEMKPGEVNTTLKVVTGEKMSNGEVLISEEEAAQIEAKGTDYDPVDAKDEYGSQNQVQIYKDESGGHIEVAFVGNYPNVRPYGVTTGGKSFYLHNNQIGYDDKHWKTTNWKLIPLENDVLFVSEAVHVYAEAASVVVNYVDQDGNVLTGTGTFTDDASKTLTIPGKNSEGYQVLDQEKVETSEKKAYNTTDNRPDTITTESGEVYHLIGIQTGSDAETGTLDTKGRRVITYKYQLATGDVNVHYEDTEGNVIAKEYKDTDDKPANVTNYNTAETTTPETGERPTTITVKNTDGTETVYYYKEVSTDKTKSFYDNNTPTDTSDDVLAGETGKVQEGTTNITYIYEKGGSVVVNYVDVDGNKISGTTTGITKKSVESTEADVDADGKAVTNVKPGTEYSTKDLKPETITTADGTVYHLVTKAVDGKYSAEGVKAGSDAETGKVEAGKTKEVTYVYEKAGSVVVKYITTDGKSLTGDLTFDSATSTTNVPTTGVVDEDNSAAGTTYNTTDHKPTLIKTADGKVYKLVEKAGTTSDNISYDENGVATGNGNASETGSVVAGKTQTVTYVYEEVKGNVVVKYETTDGTTLTGNLVFNDDRDETTVPQTGREVEDATDVSGGTEYDTTDYKPTTITTADGKVYKLVAQNNGLKDGSAPESGEDATVIAGETRTVTYLYEEVKGSVEVNYVDVDGNPISGTTTGISKTSVNSTEKDETDVSGGTKYDTTDLKPTKITTADGTVYYLVTKAVDGKYSADGLQEGSAPETGEVEAGETTKVTYVYEKAGSVTINYISTDGNVIKTPVKDVENGKPGDKYNAAETTTADTGEKQTLITTTDGKLYRLVSTTGTTKTGVNYDANGVATGNDNAPTTGEVVSGKDLQVTYVYEEVKGNVVVHYVVENEDGTRTELQKDYNDETNKSVGTSYNTAENTTEKPETITKDGKTYKLVKVEGNETGKVVEGTTEVTYVYKEVKGDVVVKYETTDGKALNGKLTADGKEINVPTTGIVDTPESSINTPYNTTDNKPTTITTEDGKTYKLVPTATKGVEEGKVVEGTTTITYVYEEVKGDVVVKYETTDGKALNGKLTADGKEINVPTTGIVDTPESSINTPYNTTDNKPTTITTEDGKTYYYKEVKSDSAKETGKVVEGTTTVTYVYEEAGSVVVNYVDEKGNVIKTPVTDENASKPGTKYDTTDNKPTTITTKEGKTYELVEVKGNESGEVQSGKTLEVTYVYKLVPMTKFIEEGTEKELSTPEKGTQNPKAITGYELVRTVTDKDGSTVHIYKKVTNPTTGKVTKYVDENGNPVSNEEVGTKPKKDIPGYEYVRTYTDKDGNTVHVYKKVTTPGSVIPTAAKAKELPNTAATNNSANTAAAGAGLIALIAAAVRRKNNK